MGVDWSELPQEIIEYISKRLTIYADYLRFRWVCRSWNSSLPKTPLHLPPQLPWLMISHNSFFDLSNNKIHRLNLPPPSGPTRICGSSHGWLVILKLTSELTLLNPITRATLSLPSLNTYPHLVRRLFYNNNSNFHRIKVVLSSSPSSLSDDDDFVAFAILNRRDFVFCRKGYNSWVLLNVSENNHEWKDAVYKNGSFFVTSTSGSGTIAVCGVEDPGVSFVEVPVHASVNSKYLNPIYYIVFAGEDMLLVQPVQRIYIAEEEPQVMPQWLNVGFLIFKMNWNAHMWEEIQTLGEHSVFIGKNSSLYFSAADFVGCRPNCIYFADDGLVGDPECGIYSVLDKSIDQLSCYSYISDCGSGYPFWVTPNPR